MNKSQLKLTMISIVVASVILQATPTKANSCNEQVFPQYFIRSLIKTDGQQLKFATKTIQDISQVVVLEAGESDELHRNAIPISRCYLSPIDLIVGGEFFNGPSTIRSIFGLRKINEHMVVTIERKDDIYPSDRVHPGNLVGKSGYNDEYSKSIYRFSWQWAKDNDGRDCRVLTIVS